MTKAKHSGAFKGHRFPPEVIAHAVWSYFRFPLSLHDVEDLLATHGIIVSYDTTRKRIGKFGTRNAASILLNRPAPSDIGTLMKSSWFCCKVLTLCLDRDTARFVEGGIEVEVGS